MSTITPKTVYPYKGKEYKSLADVKTCIENNIGAIIDTLPERLPPKQALELLNVIIHNKNDLVALLTVEVESDEWQERNRNIFDILT